MLIDGNRERRREGRNVVPAAYHFCGMRDELLSALGDDHALNLRVGIAWNDSLLRELIFSGIRATFDDAVCVGVSDARQCLELVMRSSVDVERIALRSGNGGLCLGPGNLGYRCQSYREEKRGSQNAL